MTEKLLNNILNKFYSSNAVPIPKDTRLYFVSFKSKNSKIEHLCRDLRHALNLFKTEAKSKNPENLMIIQIILIQDTPLRIMEDEEKEICVQGFDKLEISTYVKAEKEKVKTTKNVEELNILIQKLESKNYEVTKRKKNSYRAISPNKEKVIIFKLIKEGNKL